MSQSSGVKPPKSSQSELEPTLTAVLGCLDVELEEELTRYRRYRRHDPSSEATSNTPSNQSTQKPSEVLKITALDHTIEPSSSPTSSSQSKPPSPNQPPGWESVVMPQSAPLAVQSKNGNTHSSTSPKTPTRDKVTPGSSEESPTGLNGYLESSEKLVKSLDERPTRRRRRQRSGVASLFTPVGMGSMLLFLASCLTLGYVVLSPSGMESLGLNRWFKFNAGRTNSEDPAETTIESVEPQPNLANREFVNLDLDTLSHINPSPSPIPSATTQPSTPAPDSNLTPPSPLPSGPGMNNLTNELIPDPVPPTPKPAPPVTPKPATGAATKPKTEPVQAQDGFYYVVTPYNGERSLEKVREVVPDAYVREFKTGAKIQMGALDTPASAQLLAEELRVQGISIQYDTPKAGEF